MRRHSGWAAALALALIITSLALSACGAGVAAPEGETPPARVEHLEGVNPTRETLTEEAVKRLDIQTAPVRETDFNGRPRKVIPYAAIIYDTQGATWVYTNPEPLVFLRQPITVQDIRGDEAVLTAGPDAGSPVVTVGAAELYGAEFEFQEE